MRTKIVATIGPASNSKEKLRQLVEAGVSVFRLNFSHGSAADFVRIINDIREVEKELDKPITIMQDLSGPKIRLGVVQEKTIQVTKGMQLLLGLSDQRTDEMPFLPFDHPEILETLEPGDRMVLADGGLQFTVQQSRPDGLVLLEANNSGIVTSRKGLALPGKATKVRALTEKDKKDLSDGLALGVDAVAISYVQTADDVREAKQLIAASGRRVPVVVKLERQNAVDNLDEILKETDVIMVARGDLGAWNAPCPCCPPCRSASSAPATPSQAGHRGHADAALHGQQPRPHPRRDHGRGQCRAGRRRLRDALRRDRHGQLPGGDRAVHAQDHRRGGEAAGQ